MATERTYRGVSAEERRSQRHRQLLDATLALWGDPQLPKVTMTGVCTAAGLTERYFYESFDHLDVALRAVLDEIGTEIDQATVELLAQAGADPVARVHAVVGAFVTVLTEDARKGRVVMVESAGLPDTRERRALLLRRLARLVAREARKLYGPNAWAHDGALAASFFVGGVVQLVTGWLDGTVEATPEQLVATAQRTFQATAHL